VALRLVLDLNLASPDCHFQERKLDEKLPLLFAGNKYPASKVQVSATGVLNGAAAASEEEEPMSSSAVAVASPSGMLLEKKPQTEASVSDSEVPATEKPIDSEPLPVVEEETVSSPVSLYNQIVMPFLITFARSVQTQSIKQVSVN